MTASQIHNLTLVQQTRRGNLLGKETLDVSLVMEEMMRIPKGVPNGTWGEVANV
jgi:hypothetical protein